MAKEIVIDSYIDYDGILTSDERKKILNRIESAFSWLGATIPEEIELDGEKVQLRSEIQKLILKAQLSSAENLRIEKLISSLETKERGLVNIIKNENIPDYDALELSNKICGLLRAVHNLRDLIKRVPDSSSKALDAKQKLLDDVEDEKRWLKYVKKVQ